MDDTKKLYLQLGPDSCVSVPCKSLVQHQIDGIRFLFEQYRKKKSGVLLNYSAGCGRSVMVALFINAVIAELDRPVLILYEQDREKQEWLDLFAKWTTINTDEIAVDPTNICVRNQIIIKDVADVSTCCSRTWSMLLVKTEDDNKMLFKWQLKVTFKIWITSLDVMKDLNMLHCIYTWINSSLDTRLKELIEKKIELCSKIETSKDQITNDLLLHSFLEDFLLRRNNLKPFITNLPQRSSNKRFQQVLIKNKDATGTKIKRSQKYQDVPTLIDTPQFQTPDNGSFCRIDDGTTAKHSKKSRKDLANENEESKMDVESFIRDNEPLETDSNLNMAIKHLDDKTLYPNVASRIEAEEICTGSYLNFDSAVEDIVNVENNLITEKATSQNSQRYDIGFKDLKNTRHFEEIVFNPIDVYTPKIQDVFSINEINSKTELNKDCSKDKNSKDRNEDNKELGDEIFENSRDKGCIRIKDEGNLDGDQGTRSGDELIPDDSICIKDEGVQNGDETIIRRDDRYQGENDSRNGYNGIKVGDESVHFGGDNICEGESICIKKEVIYGEDEGSNNGIVDQNSELEITTSVMKENDIFDSKMKEMEEQALKKFKGSFLDNIFK